MIETPMLVAARAFAAAARTEATYFRLRATTARTTANSNTCAAIVAAQASYVSKEIAARYEVSASTAEEIAVDAEAIAEQLTERAKDPR